MNLFKKIITYRPNFTIRILTGLISFLIMLSVCTVVGIADIGAGDLGERDINFKARSVEAGARIYSEQCARCHGLDGKGIDGQGPTLSHISFVGKTEERISAGNVLEINEVTKSERLKQLGWTGSLVNYIKGVVAAGIPVKSSNVWEVNHPTFAQSYGGNLRDDQVVNVSNYVANWALAPNEDSDAIIPPAPGEGGAPKPTAVPLTPDQEAGKGLVVSLGCNACHAIKGVMNGAVGPNLSQIASVAEERIASEHYKANLKDQPAATTAEEYIIQSIHYSNSYVVDKCPQGACAAGVMPQTYRQSIQEDDFKKLVSYLLTLKK
jgi:mono/diheme cytochrome c family protein